MFLYVLLALFLLTALNAHVLWYVAFAAYFGYMHWAGLRRRRMEREVLQAIVDSATKGATTKSAEGAPDA